MQHSVLTMEQINNIRVVPCTNSNYLKPFRVHYSQKGQKKAWDFMRTHDSVSVLVFNTTSHCFILVKQFRPAVFMCEWERGQPEEGRGKPREAEPREAEPREAELQEAASDAEVLDNHPDLPPASVGITYELCAGLVDKPYLSLEEIARQEVLEECGYDVPVTKLRRITSCRSGVGVTGSRQTLFYAEVSEDNCVGEGGGLPQEGELIEVVKVPLQEALNFAYDENIPKTMGVILSFLWFLSNMSPKFRISTCV